MHLVGGEYDVSGVCFPGTPFVILGQNRNAAWGFTNLMTDDLDFYVEKVNPDNSNQYYYDGIWKEMILRDEQIPVKGGKTQTLLVRETHRGPVISDLHPLATGGDRVISFRWTGREMSDEVDAFLRLNTMENWREFQTAVSRSPFRDKTLFMPTQKGTSAGGRVSGFPNERVGRLLCRCRERHRNMTGRALSNLQHCQGSTILPLVSSQRRITGQYLTIPLIMYQASGMKNLDMTESQNFLMGGQTSPLMI